MSLKERISELIIKRKKINPNDPAIKVIWSQLVCILKDDEEETISLLKASNKEELYWLSEIFEDLSFAFQSNKFIDCLLELQEKFPDIGVEEDIKYAIQSLKSNESNH
ncbi:hypothetical protein [Cytobacillus massiliigabonensis]|uniref:hypothetical protein n=1 Tax=Cytobacillus massiliigabonensis TaxID=1871011 RepID=UPI000C82CAA5|nr:hypothetical protein [Cytobacillus massiliigabonensis]